VAIGSPTLRRLGMVILGGAAWIAAATAYFRFGVSVSDQGWLVGLDVVALVILLVYVAGFRRITILPGGLESRAWIEIAFADPGALHEFQPGDVACHTPGGRWVLNGRWIRFRVPPGSGGELRRRLVEAGIEIEDQAAMWTRDHPWKARGPYLGSGLWLAYLIAKSVGPPDLAGWLIWPCVIGMWAWLLKGQPPAEYRPKS
jgi:hypothetical protein